MKTQYRPRALLTVLTAMMIAACGSGGSSDSIDPVPPVDKLKSTPQSELTLRRRQSCDSLKDYVADSISELLLSTAWVYCFECVLTAEGAPGVAGGAAADATSFQAFTGTNNQEAGVDELDLVEANIDGFLFTVDGRHVVIADGLPPADLQEIASIKITDNGFVNGMLYDDVNDRLVVAASIFGFTDPNMTSLVAPDFWQTPQAELHFFDVADPANPVLLKRMLIDGFEIAVRRIGSRVHLVTHFSPQMPVEIIEDEELRDLLARYQDAVRAEDDDAIASLAAQIRAKVTAIVASYDALDFLPGLWTQEPGADYVAVPNPNCEIVRPDVTLLYALMSITSVDSDGGNVASTTVTNNSWSIYASNENLYMMQPSGGWWWDPLQRQETAIYKFGIGSGAAEYAAIGKVDGWAFDSFFMSEHEGFLRVTTHRNEREPSAAVPTVDNNLYVLEDTGSGELRTVSSVEGFGPDERPFSARFLGDRGFVVTFRQIDPLFAFDLSDPFNATLVGELEIPGVSTYIHPLGNDHLLTIGFDGDEQGLDPGFLLQIFDISDLNNPTQAHAFAPEFDAEGFAWTRAVWDHLSFNYFPEGGVLTIPVQYWSSDWELHFSGFAAFGVDLATGFTELGRLDHSDFAKEEHCPDPADPNDGSVCELGYYLSAADPRRSVSALWTDETLGEQLLIYTFSDVAIKVSEASDFGTPIGELKLSYPNSYWWMATQ